MIEIRNDNSTNINLSFKLLFSANQILQAFSLGEPKLQATCLCNYATRPVFPDSICYQRT